MEFCTDCSLHIRNAIALSAYCTTRCTGGIHEWPANSPDSNYTQASALYRLLFTVFPKKIS